MLRFTPMPLALVLVDIDDFKQINDAFTHVVGDEVLRRVAECLGRELRMGDHLARYGGDEFIALLPRTGRPGGPPGRRADERGDRPAPVGRAGRRPARPGDDGLRRAVVADRAPAGPGRREPVPPGRRGAARGEAGPVGPAAGGRLAGGGPAPTHRRRRSRPARGTAAAGPAAATDAAAENRPRRRGRSPPPSPPRSRPGRTAPAITRIRRTRCRATTLTTSRRQTESLPRSRRRRATVIDFSGAATTRTPFGCTAVQARQPSAARSAAPPRRRRSWRHRDVLVVGVGQVRGRPGRSSPPGCRAR